MATYARIVGGYTVDVVVDADPVDIYGQAQVDAWDAAGVGFVAVPDGTLNGAADNGDGTFTNPSEPEPAEPQPVELTQVAFIDMAIVALGGMPAGLVRYETVILAAEAQAGVIVGVKTALDQYRMAKSLEKPKVADMLGLFVSNSTGDLTTEEMNAVLAAWPTA